MPHEHRLRRPLRRSMLSLPLLGAFVIAGCTHVVAGSAVQNPEGRGLATGECDELHEDSNVSIGADQGSGLAILPKMSPRTQILLLVCNETIAAAPTIDQESFVAAHQHYDDRRGDPLAAALMVVACQRSMSCYQRLVAEPGAPDPATGTAYHLRDAKAALGMLSYYTRAATPAEVAAAVEPLRLSASARSTFVALFASAATRFADRIAHFSPAEKEIFVDVPEHVRSERQSYFQRHAKPYQRLDSILAAGGSDARGLQALRSEFIAACRESSCRFEPFYVEVSQEIAARCTIAGDALCAHAESNVLQESRANRNSYGHSIYRAQLIALKASNEAFERLAEARQNGLDRAILNTPPGAIEPLDYSSGRLWRIGDEVARMAALVSFDGFAIESGVVKTKKREGDLVRVRFATESFTFDDPYDCVPTDRISRVWPDGSIEYETRCKWGKRQSQGTTTPPILLPAGEAQGLGPGELVVFVTDTETRYARLQTATRDGHVVQQRADRFVVGEGRISPSR